MTRPDFSLILTIAGIIVGFVSSLLGNLLLGAIATAIAIIGASLQYYASKPFVLEFNESNWAQVDDEYIITVPARQHKRQRDITSTVYIVKSGAYEVVGCDEKSNSDGSFAIAALLPFTGRLVLK